MSAPGSGSRADESSSANKKALPHRRLPRIMALSSGTRRSVGGKGFVALRPEISAYDRIDEFSRGKNNAKVKPTTGHLHFRDLMDNSLWIIRWNSEPWPL